MDVRCRDNGDRRRLVELVRSERDAKQRDRWRAALLAIEGRPEPGAGPLAAVRAAVGVRLP